MSVGIELCEETPLPVFESKLDVWACLLMKRVGCVCERLALIAGLRNGMLAEDLDRVVAYVRVLALIGGVDLDVAIARKFNKTSIANGLATRMCEAA